MAWLPFAPLARSAPTRCSRSTLTTLCAAAAARSAAVPTSSTSIIDHRHPSRVRCASTSARHPQQQDAPSTASDKAGKRASQATRVIKQSGPRLLRLPGKAAQLGRVTAVTYAEELAVPSLIKALNEHGLVGSGSHKDALNIEGEALLLPDWHGGQCFLFENGGAAYWGVSPQGVELMEQCVINRPGVRVKPLALGSQSESLGFAYQLPFSKPNTDMLYLQEPFQQPQEDLGDQQLTVAMVPPPGGTVPSSCDLDALRQQEHHEGLSMSRKALAERLAISSAMIRSTKIAVYESELENHLEEIEEIPVALLEQQKVPGENTLIQHAGFLLSIRQRINLTDFNLLDAPEFLWEVGSDIEESFLQACAAQDLEQRLHILNKKLDYAEAQNAKLLELENTRTSHRLEWIIIVLIALEIGLALLREGLPALPFKKKQQHQQQPAEHQHAV